VKLSIFSSFPWLLLSRPLFLLQLLFRFIACRSAFLFYVPAASLYQSGSKFYGLSAVPEAVIVSSVVPTIESSPSCDQFFCFFLSLLLSPSALSLIPDCGPPVSATLVNFSFRAHNLSTMVLLLSWSPFL